MVVFTFAALDQKYLFGANLVQKIKIASLSWNLLPRLIQIRRIQCWCLIFLFSIGITFFGQIGPTNKNRQFILNFGTSTNLNMIRI